MKSTILKPSAIALLISGAISTSAFADRIDDAIDALNEATTRMQNLSGSISNKADQQAVDTNKQNIETNKTAIETNKEKIANLQDVLVKAIGSDDEANPSGLLGSLDLANKQLGEHEARIGSLEDSADALIVKHNELRDDVDQNRAEIAALSEGLITVRNEQNTHTTDIAGIKESLQYVNTLLGEGGNVVETLDDHINRIEANETAIADHETRIDTVEERSTANQDKLLKQGNLINRNASDITEIKNDLRYQDHALVKKEIAANKTAIENVDAKVADLAANVSETLTSYNEATQKAINDADAKLRADIQTGLDDAVDAAGTYTDQEIDALTKLIVGDDKADTEEGKLGLIGSVEADIKDHEARIKANEEDLETVNKNVNFLEEVKADKSDVEALTTETKTAVTDLGNRINNNTTDIENLRNYTGTLADDLDKHEEAIDAVANQVAENMGDIEANKAEIANIKDVHNKAVDFIDDRLNELDEDLGVVESRVADHSVELEVLKQAHNEAIESLASKELVEDLATDVEANMNAIEAHKEALSQLDAGLAVTNAVVAENRKDIDAHKKAISAVADQVAENMGDIETNKAGIASNQTEIAKHEEQISGLANSVAGHDEDIAELQEYTGSVEKQVGRVADEQALVKKDVETVNAKVENKADKHVVEAHTASINTNKANVEANKSAIASNKAEVATNKAAIRANTASIQNNTATLATKADVATVEANTARINQNTARINQNTARIDQLDNRVNRLNKEVKRGLATQSALSGLFQPYKVGKANVTAAVGGYKSETALAVGTGYRFNENVAAKAGVAFSTKGGSVSYNAGVNFEW